MTGFALYSSDDSPDRLYSHGSVDGFDPDRVAAMVRYGDRPLDLVVDLGDRQVFWSLTAERRTTTERTGYFVAAYQGDDGLFHGFERELRRVHETDAWSIPYTGAIRWDVGFQLWRVASDPPAQSRRQFDRLADRLQHRERTEPVEFGMRNYASALQVVRALDAAGLDCTVAVSTGGSGTTPVGVDLVFHPGADDDFEPRSLRATGIVGPHDSNHGDPPSARGNSGDSSTRGAFEKSIQRESDGTNHGASDHGVSNDGASNGVIGDGRSDAASSGGAETDVSEFRPPADATRNRLSSRLAAALVVVLLGFGTYSFLSTDPVHPITGLGAFGGLGGSIAALVVTDRFGTDEGRRSTADGVVYDLLGRDLGRALPVIAYGTFLGFAFPRIFWLLGTVLGGSGFIFGTVASAGGALPSVLTYVGLVYVFSLGLVLSKPAAFGAHSPSRALLKRTAAAHGAYALCLFLATGFADVLWFQLIPSATS